LFCSSAAPYFLSLSFLPYLLLLLLFHILPSNFAAPLYLVKKVPGSSLDQSTVYHLKYFSVFLSSARQMG
jgi:hypothetical protein